MKPVYFDKVMKKEEIIKNIGTLVIEQGFVYALVIMLYHDLFYPPKEIVNINWRERLNYNEFSFLVGLMVKNDIDRTMTIPTEETIKEQIDRAYELFDELHQAYLIPMKSSMQRIFQEPSSPEKVNEGFKAMFQSGEVTVEAIFYGGSGAYDFQYLEFAGKRYQKDVAWIQANKNLDIKKVAEITNKLKKITENKLNTLPPEGFNTFDKYCKWILQGFCFSKADLQDSQEDIVEAFLNTFSTIPGTVNQKYSLPGDYNVIDSHPIIRLESNLYLNLARSSKKRSENVWVTPL